MPKQATTITPPRLLIGRLAEYQELLGVLDSRQGLTVIAADPWSGTSAVVRSAIEEISWPCVLVDARSCTDELDLAMAIADATVATLAPQASGWWQRLAPPASRAGLELSRVLSIQDIHLEDLQLGAGRAEERLDEAFRLLVALAAPQPATLVIDHAGLLLAGLPAPESRKLLGDLRSLRQTHEALDLLLIEHPDGEASTALQDTDHPLYRAGRELRLRRPDPARYVDDLAIARPWTDVPVPLLRIAADLAAGVPWLTWQIIDHGGSSKRRSPRSGARRLGGSTSGDRARHGPAVGPVAAPASAGSDRGRGAGFRTQTTQHRRELQERERCPAAPQRRRARVAARAAALGQRRSPARSLGARTPSALDSPTTRRTVSAHESGRTERVRFGLRTRRQALRGSGRRALAHASRPPDGREFAGRDPPRQLEPAPQR